MPRLPDQTTLRPRVPAVTAVFAAVAASVMLLGATPVRVMAQAKYIAPDNNTVRTFLEAARGQVNTRVVRVENLSTVPIVVTQVVLTNCNNVGYVCGMNEMETTVEPGKRKTVLEVEPANIERAVSFGYRFRWRHKTRQAILGALASGGDSAAAARLAQVERAEAARAASARPGERELFAHEVVALGDEVAALRADSVAFVVSLLAGARCIGVAGTTRLDHCAGTRPTDAHRAPASGALRGPGFGVR